MTPRDGTTETCVGCARQWCPDDDTSPGEVDGLCPACWATEDMEESA